MVTFYPLLEDYSLIVERFAGLNDSDRYVGGGVSSW
jgi:hypothetical protein